ncbi:MAG: flavodoxin family protein [Methanobacterium sp.]|jgi:flavodoxin
MKIGIIVYSQTNNTYSVAEKLQEKLAVAGNEVNIEKVIPVGEVHPGSKNIEFENKPDVNEYDALIFGSPVQGFSLAPAMKAYMEQMAPLQDKRIACFVTKKLPFNWTGGTRAIGQMKKICQAKGGIVYGTGIVVWNKQRDEKIAEMVEEFSNLF